jgi:3-oxoacyl-[acyl-carrier protein] reductase
VAARLQRVPPRSRSGSKALPTEWAEIGILVNNAGITADNLLARMSLEQWQRVLDTNLTGTFAVTRELVRGMIRQRWGRVVTVSSVVGLMGNAGQANYAAAKAGPDRLLEVAGARARQPQRHRQRRRPGIRRDGDDGGAARRAREKMLGDIPAGRFGRDDDDRRRRRLPGERRGGYVTGQVLNVSGGLYI